MRSPSLLGTALLTLLLFGCGGNVGSGCDVVAEDPVLRLRSAASADGATPIPRVVLSEFTVDGQPASAELLIHPRTSYKVAAEGGRLECDLPSGFGEYEGAYEFTASAAGYRPARVRVEAKYTRSRNESCRVVLGGSTPVDLRLEPEAAP